MEGVRKESGMRREGGGGICGEIIISSVTVATFGEVDVNNKILSNTIHFNFTSKKDVVEGCVWGFFFSCGNTHAHTYTRRQGECGWQRALLTDYSTSSPVVI